MQYSQEKTKSNKTFYGIIAVCLVAIALTSYIAIQRNNAKDKNTNENDNTVINEENDTYNNNDKEETKESGKATEPTEKKSDDVPYTKETDTETKVEAKKETAKQVFVMPTKGKIIKQYSDNTLQYDKTFGDMRLHKAIDIACEENAQIVSASSGTVTDVKDSAEFNKIVTIDHGNGYTVEYCGLGTTAVKKGETIGAGVLIGTAKNPPCECLDECHIHIICLKDGVPFDPIALYNQNK